jgi:hypothetical protein
MDQLAGTAGSCGAPPYARRSYAGGAGSDRLLASARPVGRRVAQVLQLGDIDANPGRSSCSGADVDPDQADQTWSASTNADHPTSFKCKRRTEPVLHSVVGIQIVNVDTKIFNHYLLDYRNYHCICLMD